ncbi:reverse transcriptase [Tanacetum coccineum]
MSNIVPYRRQFTHKELDDKRSKNQWVFVCEDSAVQNREGSSGECQEEINVVAQPHISLNAISGVDTFQTMRVKGQINNRPVNILIDCGGCEMVLGVQWLATLGDIVCNFLKLRMEFIYQGRKKYEKVFVVPITLPPNRKHDHRIPLLDNSTPVNIRPYRHPPTQKDVIEAMVTRLLESGVIRESHIPFSSPIVMVKKKDGTWRMCVDYRALNKKTVKDKFHIPIIEELIDELFGAQVFTKLDLRSGYHQIRMSEEDVHKTAFRTHQVFFEDIFVYSRDIEEHAKHLERVLHTMQSRQLYAKMSKCVFGTTQVEYLGHVISGEGVSTDVSKVKAMQDWPVPVNIKKLRGFLGLTGYYRRFIKNYASISKPLTALLKKNAFKWSQQAQEAFEDLKKAMMNAHVLALPNFEEEFIMETYASDEGIGAVLQQRGHPIAFLSRSLAPRHKGLSTYEKELWVVVYALENWRVWTDVTMDFIEGLPSSQGKTVILVVVDRLSKYAHFIPLVHPFKAAQIARVFLDTVYKLHGLPQTITSDRDKVFISHFWKELFKKLGVTLQLSTSYHPKTDGQSEIVNKCLECYLRCMTSEQPKKWVNWLALTEFWYNTNYHTTINTTPFEVVYGQKPPTHVTYMADDSHVESMDRTLVAREADIGDSQAWRGGLQVCNKEGLSTVVPVVVLDRKIAKVKNAVVVYWLVQWSNGNVNDATWEEANDLQTRYPGFGMDS